MKNEREVAAAGAPASPDPKSYGLELIDVVLDNKDGVYMSGESVTGKVVLQLSAPLEVLGIRMRCKGEARVHFTDRSVGIRRKYAAEESYVHLEPYLLGDGASRSRVDSGAYEFGVKLPEKVPCSFEGLYGRVRYSLRASLVVSQDVVLHGPVLPFSLFSPCDLNDDSLAPLPISETQSKTFIGQKEALRMELGLPVRGFVPGQTVPMEINLLNESNVRVSKIRIVLKKVVVYHAKEKSRRHKEIVVEIELPVERREARYHENFDVPSVPPSGMNFCSVIDVRYALKVEACVDLGEWYYRMLQKNLKIRTDIVVGTIPLGNCDDVINERLGTINELPTLMSNEEEYQKGQFCRSSKPDRDDPTGEEVDSDGDVAPYSPMYLVYKYEKPTNQQ